MTTITIDRKLLEEIVELFDDAISTRYPHEILRDIRAALAAPATAQAATDAALERAEKACEEEAADIRSEGKGCHTGQYDHMADGAGRCAQAIRALKEQP